MNIEKQQSKEIFSVMSAYRCGNDHGLFRRIIEDLEQSGMSQKTLAAHVSTTQQNISLIKTRAREPKYWLGVDLISLHKYVHAPGRHN